MPEKLWTYEEAKADALARHPDCSYAEWTNGLTAFFQLTIVVNLWRNEECYLNDDPPKYTVEGYLPDRERNQAESIVRNRAACAEFNVPTN